MKKSLKNFLEIGLLFLLISYSSIAFSQEDTSGVENTQITLDSLKNDTPKKDTHSVKKAVIFSAVLPGLGQAYNRKWWKIPIFYAGLGTLGYFAYTNHVQHTALVNEYINRQDNPSYIIPDEYQNLDDQALITQHRSYQDNRDLMILGFIAVYAVNLIDAAVDAHFFYYDISDDLSLNWSPLLTPNCTGISLGLKIKNKAPRTITPTIFK